MIEMLSYILYAQFLFYLYQTFFLMLGIATLLVVLYIVVGLLLWKRYMQRGEDVSQ